MPRPMAGTLHALIHRLTRRPCNGACGLRKCGRGCLAWTRRYRMVAESSTWGVGLDYCYCNWPQIIPLLGLWGSTLSKSVAWRPRGA